MEEIKGWPWLDTVINGSAPGWRCSQGHRNSTMTGKCGICKEHRPCEYVTERAPGDQVTCGTKPTRFYVRGPRCDEHDPGDET